MFALVFPSMIADNIIIMMCITDEAIKLIKELQTQSESDNLKLTLFSGGVGCGAPVIKLEMREPMDDDIKSEISGFTFHIRAAIERYLEDSEILVEETFWGKKLKVKTVFGCS